jgi:hypothetical protein
LALTVLYSERWLPASLLQCFDGTRTQLWVRYLLCELKARCVRSLWKSEDGPGVLAVPAPDRPGTGDRPKSGGSAATNCSSLIGFENSLWISRPLSAVEAKNRGFNHMLRVSLLCDAPYHISLSALHWRHERYTAKAFSPRSIRNVSLGMFVFNVLIFLTPS